MLARCYPRLPRRAAALLRPFVLVQYLPGAGGRLTPEPPDRCPRSLEEQAAGNCAVRIDHVRRRKTGPEFPLTVCRCRPHGIAFTLYPAGFAPYQRQPTLRVGPGGEAVLPDAASVTLISRDFDGSLFEAAFSAAAGEPWARDSDAFVPERWWSTQLRRLSFASRLLGLAAEIGTEVRVSIAHVLDVPALRLQDLGGALTGYRTAGTAISSVLSALRRVPKRAFDLLTCAHLAGFWGEPVRWLGGHGYRRIAFPALATTGGP